jgi:hypothetical protein
MKSEASEEVWDVEKDLRAEDAVDATTEEVADKA